MCSKYHPVNVKIVQNAKVDIFLSYDLTFYFWFAGFNEMLQRREVGIIIQSKASGSALP